MSEETIPQMRDALDKANERIKTLEGDVQTKDFEIKKRDAREAFRGAGYNPKHGDLFARDNPEASEITAEAVASYAEEWNLAPLSTNEPPAPEGDDTSDEDDGTDALSSLDRSGTRGGDGGGGSSGEPKLTRQDWMELQATDPVAASAALRQGRVELSTGGNLRAGQKSVRGGNPYEPQVDS